MSNRKMKFGAAAGLAVLALAGVSSAFVAGAAGARSAQETAAPTATQDAFNRKMQVMRAQMMQLHAAGDPAVRSKLLAEHMQTMQDTMRMMMGRGGMRGPGAGMMQGAGMHGQGGMMGNGQMMQMMLGQMMQHQQAMHAMGCAK